MKEINKILFKELTAKELANKILEIEQENKYRIIHIQDNTIYQDMLCKEPLILHFFDLEVEEIDYGNK